MKASPASRLACAIALRAAASCGSRHRARAGSRATSAIACSAWMSVERVVGQRDERLDAVGQRVQAGGGVELVGHRRQQPRVGDRDVGHQRPAHDGDLVVPLGVGDDAELARRRRRCPRCDGIIISGGIGCVDPVDALVVEDVAAVGREHRDALGGVDAPSRRRCRSRRRSRTRGSGRTPAAISWSLGFGVTSNHSRGPQPGVARGGPAARRPSRPR